MKKIKNSKKNSFLDSLPTASIDLKTDTLTSRCKFNFSYMDFAQTAGQKFEDWPKEQLSKLLKKLCDYSKETLEYWQQQRVGAKNNKVLEIYGGFPINSDFVHPKHVPHQVLWGRFRLEQKVRFVGFILPEDYHNKENKHTGYHFDGNTFYAVFLDANHRFYITQRKNKWLLRCECSPPESIKDSEGELLGRKVKRGEQHVRPI